jgi:hypothetical protein
MRHRTVRSCSALLLATYLSACTAWKVQQVAPQEALADAQFVRRGVQVTTLEGERIRVAQPVLKGDTLTGMRDTTAVAIPLSQVRELSVRRPSGGRTALLVVGSMVGAAAATLGALCIAFCGLED